jgi:hypothetical protein
MEELITAYITDRETDKPLGYLSQKSYNHKIKELVVVPVSITENGNEIFSSKDKAPDATKLKEYLDGVYNQAVVEWNVEVEKEPFTIKRSVYDDVNKGEKDDKSNNNDKKFDCETSKSSSFTKELDAFINAYDSNRGFSKRKYYIFLVYSFRLVIKLCEFVNILFIREFAIHNS